MIFYAEFYTESSISGVIELFPIVDNNNLRNIESTDDGLLNEVPNVSLGNFCQGLSLHPLSKVIDSYYKEFHLLFSLAECPNYVYLSLREGRRALYRCQLFCQFLGDARKPLALVTPLGEEGDIFLHGGPIVFGPDCFVGYRSASRVIPTYSFMDLSEYIVGFLLGHASE